MLPQRSEGGLGDEVRTFANHEPVLFADILVDLDLAWVERVLSIFPRAGDPVVLPRFLIKVGCLVPSSVQRREGASAVVDGPTRLRERDPADAARPTKAAAFDVHDSSLQSGH